MRWLVTGGAGYIGAHVVAEMSAAGHDLVVLDDLSSGRRERVPEHVLFVEGSVLDPDRVRTALEGVEGVVHIAAKKQVGESVADPLMYYRENLGGLEVLLEQAARAHVQRFVFSSSAAVYGDVSDAEVPEDSPTVPTSPYGETKLAGEWLVRDCAVAYGMSAVLLRYFNVAGAGSPQLGDEGVFNLVPLLFQALTAGKRPQVFGADYPTPDGSCVRDYVHVADIARAHRLSADLALAPGETRTYNIGGGTGTSVLEMLGAVAEVTGIDTPHEVAPRRPGDPPSIIASVGRIQAELGFATEHDLRSMVSSAWEAWQRRHASAP